MDLKELPIGTEGKLDLKVEDGKVILSAEHNHASGSIKFEAAEDLKYFLEKLKPLLPAWASIVITAGEAALP